jgi:hypothetical protein
MQLKTRLLVPLGSPNTLNNRKMYQGCAHAATALAPVGAEVLTQYLDRKAWVELER